VFEINSQELAIRNDQALYILLHTLASGIMVKLDMKGYGVDVAVIDLVGLKPYKISSSISTTIYILLKTYKDKRKLTELPPLSSPMPNDAIRGP
jgi:hypothetical protein